MHLTRVTEVLSLLPAHGVGSRKDLPLPFAFLVAGAAAALVISFIALVIFSRAPRPRRRDGWSLPRPVARLLSSRFLRGGAAILTGLLASCTLAALALGSDDARNPAAYVIFVWMWLGIVALSLILGPVWPVINPLRRTHAALCRVAGLDPEVGLRRYRAGSWPAAALLFAFAWLELVAPDRASRPVLGLAVGLFVVGSLVAGLVYGTNWFNQGDPFETMSRLYGALSPLGRRADGTWLLRSPLRGLDAIAPTRGLLPVVSVLLGSTAYDAVTGVPAWFSFAQSSSSPVVVQSVGLLVVCVAIGGLVTLAARLGALWAGAATTDVGTQFAASLVPVAAGYVVAHYWSLAVYAGQYTLALLSDPLGDGSDWLGTADLVPNTALIAPTTVASIQAVAVVTGHLIGIVHAHSRALTVFPGRSALRGQLPMMVLMVGYTCGGLVLLFSA